MKPQDFITLCRQEPFHPFRVWLADGRSYDVVHPELLLVGARSLTIGIPRKGSNKPFFENLAIVAISDVKTIEELDDAMALHE